MTQLSIIFAIARSSKWNPIEVPFTAIGVFIGCWSVWHLRRQLSALPEPLRGKSLIRTGPYHFVRHPIYFAIFIWVVGKVVSLQNLSILILGALLSFVLFFKIKHEENLLMETYPDYKDYRKETAQLIPFLF